MNTATGIAVALAVAVALGFLFLGSSVFAPFTPEPTPTENNSKTTMEDATELSATDQQPGTGATAEVGDTVTMQYVGMLTDGSVFDASANHGTEGFTFVLGSGAVIAGWDQGIVGMKEGGTRRLVIPASLGYGAQAVGPIPANSTLIFDVQLVKVQKGQ